MFAYCRQAANQTLIIALNMENELRTLKLSAQELGGEGQRLRLAISNLKAWRTTDG